MPRRYRDWDTDQYWEDRHAHSKWPYAAVTAGLTGYTLLVDYIARQANMPPPKRMREAAPSSAPTWYGTGPKPSSSNVWRKTGTKYNRYGSLAKEVKYFDTAVSTAVDLTGGLFDTNSSINLVPQADTESGRDGKKIIIESISFKWRWEYSPGASASPWLTFAVYVILDKQANGAQPAIGDIFNSTILPTSFMNPDNTQRFVVLKKWVVTVNTGAGVTTAYAGQGGFKEWFYRCKIPIDFSADTGAIGEVKSNNIVLCAGATREDDLVAITGNVRIRFNNAC